MSTASPVSADTAPLVELARIVPDPEQPRKHFPPGPLQELADRIWAQGLIQPVTLTPDPEGGPDKLFIGERRFRAFGLNRERSQRMLEADSNLPDDHPARRYHGWTVIPAFHRPPLAPDLRLMLQVAENDDRDDLTLYERALAVDKSRRLSGKSGKDFAADHGLDPALVSNYKVLVNAKGPTKAALEQGLLRGADAARLFMRLPADRQELFLTEATENESVLTRPMLAKVLADLERVEELSRKAKHAPPPARSSTPTRPEPPAPDGPVLDLETLIWLEDMLRSGEDSEPHRANARAVFHQAILTSSPFIVISEAPLSELSSRTLETHA